MQGGTHTRTKTGPAAVKVTGLLRLSRVGRRVGFVCRSIESVGLLGSSVYRSVESVGLSSRSIHKVCRSIGLLSLTVGLRVGPSVEFVCRSTSRSICRVCRSIGRFRARFVSFRQGS